MKDEGIVQPVSKEMEQLSPRLHQCGDSPEKSGESSLRGEVSFRMRLESRIPKLSPEIAAYVAGLIDGEGTITLTRLHAGENRRLVVSIAHTEFQILTFVIEQIRAGKITRKRTSSARHTPSFCYALTSNQALALLHQIVPYLRSYRRQRAELVLRSYRALTPGNGKYSLKQLEKRREFEETFLNLKAVQANRLLTNPIPFDRGR